MIKLIIITYILSVMYCSVFSFMAILYDKEIKLTVINYIFIITPILNLVLLWLVIYYAFKDIVNNLIFNLLLIKGRALLIIGICPKCYEDNEYCEICNNESRKIAQWMNDNDIMVIVTDWKEQIYNKYKDDIKRRKYI